VPNLIFVVRAAMLLAMTNEDDPRLYREKWCSANHAL
jgi:hypothetical protein